ncbi:hypothetical protein JI664_23445 [Rhodobacter sp. NTK016B]|uniref:hypothetical protein n=1 Tax=Rhodobacter sp. NTK016B TaxID=2759676 RepID=UPI001A8F2B8A|nr:hypothetical protein [Rhodobacter sp. NTK016B]MBN8294946.1 hypothetical protein [Rhodobacter sp. NTK016B]
MAVEWIAAGFDPGAFWGQTPRGIQRALRGAEKRRLRALSDATTAAWIGAHANHDDLRDFLSALESGPKAPLPPEAQSRALESMKQKLGTISMEEYRARLRGQA